MTESENFRFVLGYLPEIDCVPKTAATLGLSCRVAAVLNCPDVPRSALYWDMLGAFVGSLQHDSIAFEIDIDHDSITFEIGAGNVRLVFTSVDAMREYVERRPEKFGRPFNRAALLLHNEVTAIIDTEPWAMGGGPQPYSDSWTFAIYRETDEASRLKDSCYRVCSQYGVPILDEMRGLPVPQEPSLWTRLLRWVLK